MLSFILDLGQGRRFLKIDRSSLSTMYYLRLRTTNKRTYSLFAAQKLLNANFAVNCDFGKVGFMRTA